MDEKEDWTSCPVCLEQYTSDASSLVKKDTEDEECTLNVPLQSAVCSHLVCFTCVRKQAALQNHGDKPARSLKGDNSEDTVQNKLVQCPICNREDAFNADDPIMSHVTCKLVKSLQLHQQLSASRTEMQQEVNLKKSPCNDLKPDDQGKDEEIFGDVGQLQDLSSRLSPRCAAGMAEKLMRKSELIQENNHSRPNFVSGRNENKDIEEDLKVGYLHHKPEIVIAQEPTFPREQHHSSKGCAAAAMTEKLELMHASEPRHEITRSRPEFASGRNQKLVMEEDSKVSAQEPTLPWERHDRKSSTAASSSVVAANDNIEASMGSSISLIPNNVDENSMLDSLPLHLRPGAVAMDGPRIFACNSYEQEEEEESKIEASPEMIMVSATPVEEPIIVEATLMEEKDDRSCFQKYRDCFQKYRYLTRYVIAGLILAGVIAAAVTIAVVIPKQKREREITGIVATVSTQEKLMEPRSAQHAAMNWMLGDNNTDLDPKENKDRIVQRYVLAVLYYSTNGEQWPEQGNFLSPDHECRWQPILNCNTGENVTYLNANNNSLTGSIPVELGNLSQLTELYLHTNELNGAIPSELGNLAQLTTLELYANQLSGAIPIELGNLAQLTLLNLWDNQVNGTIPSELGTLAHLTYLDLSNNTLTGTIPSALGTLTQLTEIYLYINELNGVIPSELGNLMQLTTLDFSTNQLNGTIPMELVNLAQLTWLNLWDNQLNGSIPSKLGNLTQLTYLDLSNNTLTGTIPSDLRALTQLTELYLYTNKLNGTIPGELGNLAQLTTLELSINTLTGTIPSELGNLAQLTTLELSINELNGTVPLELNRLANLNDLYLYDNDDIAGDLSFLCLDGYPAVWIDDNMTNVICSCCQDYYDYYYY